MLRDYAWARDEGVWGWPIVDRYRKQLRERFDRVMNVNREWGEPGVYFTSSLEYGPNPCVTGDTLVATSEGPKYVGDLEGEQFTAIVDGRPYASTPKGFWCTGYKDVYKLTTKTVRILRCTKNHKVMARHVDEETFSWRELGELWPGDWQVRVHTQSANFEGGDKEAFDGTPYDEVKSITHEGREMVFDCTIPGPHAFSANGLYVHNCVEIGMHPTLEVTPSNIHRVQLQFEDALEGEEVSGWQGCNLTEINVATCVDEDDFVERCEIAAFIGTLQAGYTNFPYLGPVSEEIFRREALLGVSLTGMVDNPEIAFNPDLLERGAQRVKQVNRDIARMIGINPAARTTCVKPSGTASLVLGGVGSGCHDHHAPLSFRRVRASRLEPHSEYFRVLNPERAHWIDYDNYVLEFCITAPLDAACREDTSAIDFLKRVELIHKHWVEPGRAYTDHAPYLQHNVSNTVTVREDEWEEVKEYVWENRDTFGGLSFMSYFGDGKYPNAPRQALLDEEDIEHFHNLRTTLIVPDYTLLIEDEDTTKLQGEIACAGGHCVL